MAMPSIPDDLIKEIMSRTPAKSVLRFRCVSKFWRRMLSDPFFINMHLRRSIEHGPRRIILISELNQATTYSIDAENPGSDDIVPAHNQFPPLSRHFRHDIGSCHGLVCTHLKGFREYVDVWNPSSGREMRFMYQENKLVHQRDKTSFEGLPAYGFFYDPACCSYKLLRVQKLRESHSTEVMIYSMDNGGEGKSLGDVPYYMVPKRAGLADPNTGAVHWLAYSTSNELVIVAFNPVSEEFEEIPMPDIEDGLGDSAIAYLRGSLSIAFVYENKFEVWLMGEKQSWSRRFVVTPSEGLVTRRFPFTVIPVHITEKGDLVLQMEYNKLYVYKAKQKRLESVEIKYPEPDVYLLANANNPPFWALTPVESLVDIRYLESKARRRRRRRKIIRAQEAKGGYSFF